MEGMTEVLLSKLLKGDGETSVSMSGCKKDVRMQKYKEAKNGALNTLVCPGLLLKGVGTDFSPQHKQGAQENDNDDDDDDECI